MTGQIPLTDHLAIGLVANKCTKLAKISEILLLSLGLSNMKIPLCYFEHTAPLTYSLWIIANSSQQLDVLVFYCWAFHCEWNRMFPFVSFSERKKKESVINLV